MSTSEYPAQRSGDASLPRLRAVAAARPIPTEVWIVGGLMLVAAVLRFSTITSQSLWTDEALTAYEAHLPLGAMVNTMLHVETTPPLYFLLVWAVAHIFGTGEAALRSISALAGVAMVPIAFVAARDLVNRRAGLIAAAFVTVNPFLIWYSQEARAYMLFGALAGASFLWFIRSRREPSRANLMWWVIFSALALLTHYFAAFMIAPEALWLLWISRVRGSSSKRAVAVAVALVAATQVAIAPLAFIDRTHGVDWISASSKISRIGQVPLQFGVNTMYRSTTTAAGLLAGAIFLAIVAALLVAGGDRVTRRGAGVALWVAGFGVLAPLALGFIGQDYFLARNLIPVWLPVAVVASAACAVPRARVAGGLFAVVLIAGFIVATINIQGSQYLDRPAWRQAARLLGPPTVPRAIIAASGTAADPLKIYLPNVNWVQPQTRKTVIDEVDIVGTRRRQFLLADSPTSRLTLNGTSPAPAPLGSALPRSKSPRGTKLLSRVSLDQWVVARFALRHPIRVDVRQLIKMAPRFFRRAPYTLLVFFERRGR